MASNRSAFLKDFSRAIREEAAGFFIGAGMSRAAGFVDWKELLKDVATELGLDVRQEPDLVALAQYHVNHKGDRAHLNQLLVDEFTKDATLTENHRTIARLPIHTLWTTNYDRLIEEAFREARRKLDVKIRHEDMNTTMPGRDATLFKMHGDVQSPDQAVLIKEDYEAYDQHRQLFSEALKGDLVSKSFLFLGFSFEDPNIDYILSRIRVLLGVNKRRHYCIMKRLPLDLSMKGAALAEHEYRRRKMDLRIADLKRYSIEAILIDDYSEITDLLRELSQRVRMWDVFVSGSAHDFGSMGQARIEELCSLLGSALIQNDFNLVSGFGLEIGGRVIAGAINTCVSSGKWVDDRLKLRPFPQGLEPAVQTHLWGAIREDLVSGAGFAVFIAGNRLDPTTKSTVPSAGMKMEFELAKAKGKVLVPIGATGFLAREIWDQLNANVAAAFPGIDVRQEFATIGDSGKSNAEIVAATIKILRAMRDSF